MAEAAKHKGGRPKVEIDYELVERLSKLYCTQEEIATVLKVSVRTLQRKAEFCRIYKEGLANAKISLRRAQMAQALKGNGTMLVWLGKQLLGQKDQIATEMSDQRIIIDIEGE